MSSESITTKTTCSSTPIQQLTAGELTCQDYINSLTPEALEKQRQYDRAKAKKWYQENCAPKVNCPMCNKEVSKGFLPKQESRLCKPLPQVGEVVRAANFERRERRREYMKEWRERKRQEQALETQT